MPSGLLFIRLEVVDDTVLFVYGGMNTHYYRLCWIHVGVIWFRQKMHQHRFFPSGDAATIVVFLIARTIQ